MNNKHEALLCDVIEIIIERLQSAQAERRLLQPGSTERTFEDGRVFAFGEVLSIFQQEAGGHLIEPESLGLDQIDPDGEFASPG